MLPAGVLRGRCVCALVYNGRRLKVATNDSSSSSRRSSRCSQHPHQPSMPSHGSSCAVLCGRSTGACCSRRCARRMAATKKDWLCLGRRRRLCGARRAPRISTQTTRLACIPRFGNSPLIELRLTGHQNPWKEWFAAMELRKTIRQDVERTYVSLRPPPFPPPVYSSAQVPRHSVLPRPGRAGATDTRSLRVVRKESGDRVPPGHARAPRDALLRAGFRLGRRARTCSRRRTRAVVLEDMGCGRCMGLIRLRYACSGEMVRTTGCKARDITYSSAGTNGVSRQRQLLVHTSSHTST
jgi:hypothetical protein